MFFVREQRVKIISILLLLNVSWTSAELPASSYLPPNRNDQPNQFSSATPTGQSYNTNSPPIETSISLTTSEPISYNPSNFNGDSGATRNPPSNAYGLPNNNNNLPNTRPPSNVGGNNYNNANDFNRGSPIRNQQSSGDNNGYSYQQPNLPFSQSNTLGAEGTPNGGQSYQSTNPVNSPQPNTFGSTGISNAGQNYQSVGPTNPPSGISSSYFNSSPAPISLSPTYGPPSKSTGNFGGNQAGIQSTSNLLDRKPTFSSPNALPNSFRPLSNNPIPVAGTPQGSLQSVPGVSTNYGPSNIVGGSFGNFPSFGGGLNPSSNLFGSNSAQLNPNRNQYSSPDPTNISNGRPSSNFGPSGVPQTIYGPPTPNSFPNNANSLDGRPSNNLIRSGPPQTLYSFPIPSVTTPGDSFSPQGNRNKGSFQPPSPTYGPPPNSSPLGSTSQSFRPQEFDRLNQNTRPTDNSGLGFQNNSNPPRPPTSSLYGTPSSSTSNVGYSQGPTQEGSYSPSKGPSPSTSPTSNNYNFAQNQGRPSPSLQSSFNSNPSETGYPPRLQNQPQIPASTFGSSPSQGNSYIVPSNSYQQPLQSFAGENSPQSSYLPPSFNTLDNPTGFGSSSSSGYEAPRSPTNLIPSGSAFSTNGAYETPRVSTNAIPSGPGFGAGGVYDAPRLPESTPSSSSGFGAGGGGYEGPRSPTNSIPSKSSSSVNSLSPLYGTPSTNSFNQDFLSPNLGYSSGPAASPGFGNISPTTEASRPANSNSLSSSYGKPTRDYTDAVIGDYNSPTLPEQANTFSNNANSFEEFSNTGGNTQSSQNPSLDGGTTAQSAYSAFSPNPSSFKESPSRLYGAPRPTTDFTNEGNSLSFAGSGLTNAETRPETNFGSNPASTYLPPSQSDNGAFNNDDIVPSTSYTLPGDQPNSSRPGASNTVKNINRNVGSDLITGASTSPFLPFKEDLSKPNAAPSRAIYEKSQEVISNDLNSFGYESAKPAKYQFNYDVKGSGPEFSHQESRNGTTTSGSYGVVLPDGRKQVVDYEANQEGFHPKIRYEETPNNSLQQNSFLNKDQNEGYNYSPSNPSTQNFSSTPQLSSFNNQGSSSSYPDTHSSYPNRPDYSIGTLANQDSYTSPYDSSFPPLGHPVNNQGSNSNFNTYSNQGTSPSNQDGSTFDPKQSSSQLNNNGYDYPSGGNLNNQATSYDSAGYPAGHNGAKQIPFYT